MPVEHLAAWFAAGAGVTITGSAAEESEVDEDLLDAGRTLVGRRGFNCIQCHAWGASPATEYPGPDLTAMPRRLRYDWFEHIVTDPTWINPETRMPKFFHSGRSGIRRWQEVQVLRGVN